MLMKRQRGETLVEFAVALPLFLMVVLGTLELGIVVFQYNMLSDLAQEGARRASVCGFSSGLPRDPDCDIENFVRARAVGINLESVTTNPIDLTTLLRGAPVTVQVRQTFNPLTRIIPIGTLTFSSTATMIASH